MLRVLVKVTLMAYLVGGCAYHGPSQSDIDNPAVRQTPSKYALEAQPQRASGSHAGE